VFRVLVLGQSQMESVSIFVTKFISQAHLRVLLVHSFKIGKQDIIFFELKHQFFNSAFTVDFILLIYESKNMCVTTVITGTMMLFSRQH